MDVIGKVHFDRIVDKQPDGIRTIIDEKATLSGGEIQLMALARALIKDPDVLVLDEPLASLDDSVTREVCDVINSIAEDMLVILISHGRYTGLTIAQEVEVINGTIH